MPLISGDRRRGRLDRGRSQRLLRRGNIRDQPGGQLRGSPPQPRTENWFPGHGRTCAATHGPHSRQPSRHHDRRRQSPSPCVAPAWRKPSSPVGRIAGGQQTRGNRATEPRPAEWFASALREGCLHRFAADRRHGRHTAPAYEGHTRGGECLRQDGTLRWADALSGYVTTTAGERLVFSLMLNAMWHHPATTPAASSTKSP